MLAFAKQEGKEALAVTIFPSYPSFYTLDSISPLPSVSLKYYESTANHLILY